MNLEKSILSLLGFLVKGTAWLVKDKEAKTGATSGLKSDGSSAQFNRDGSWEKTFAGYSQLRMDGFSVPSFPTWSRWGIASDGEYMGLARSELHTDESGSSLYPTPTVIDSGSGRANRSPSANAQERPSLALMARKGLWPTPAAQDGKNATCPPSQKNRDTLPGAMWRTPQHADSKSSKVQAGHTTNLTHQVQGNLNPEWVETLMGFPQGWTDLTDGLQVQESHSVPGNLPEPSPRNSLTEQSA